MDLTTREGLNALIARARLQNITNRSTDLEDVRAMLDGAYVPKIGWIAPEFTPDSSRGKAWRRAIRTVTPVAPLVLAKRLAGLDFEGITWSDPDGSMEEANAAVDALNLPSLAREAAAEYTIAGVVAMMASTPAGDEDQGVNEGRPVLAILRGVNAPYTDPRDQASITGWYRAIEYAERLGKLRWWVEAMDFQDDGSTMHLVWEGLQRPTDLGLNPDQAFESTARPRFALYGLQDDGLPVSPLLANMGRILGLYATELRLAASEEMSAFPMLVVKGSPEFDQVGPAEAIVTDDEPNSGAEWMAPGDLGQLREQVRLKRDQVREALALPGGSLGSQTPSGEALAEANRGFMQETQRTADAISGVLTDAVSDYLALLDLPPVEVSVPIDRAYTTETMLDVVEKGLDLGAVPMSVAARMFQQFMGSGAYSDEELEAFLGILAERERGRDPGDLFGADA